MKTILVFTTSTGHVLTEVLAGIRAFAAGTDWVVQSFEYEGTPFPVKDLVDFWDPVGCIVECSGNNVSSATIPRRPLSNLPVVYLGSDSAVVPPGSTRVVHDAQAAASAAARELLLRNPVTLAFVGMQSKPWSDKRRDAFRTAARLNGKSVETLDVPTAGSPGSRNFTARLKKWLLGLPKPCGLFAADDTLAATVLSICRVSGLSVPDDIAVVGVDDNETICEQTVPTLSSVRPDFRKAGRFAARLLARKLLKARSTPVETVYSIIGLTRRSSTRLFKRKDAEVAAALERIHGPNGHRLTARAVLATFACSRRNAEIRFRLATGRSVLDELTDARVAVARKLLAETDLPISAIADQCGYRSQAPFRKTFKAATGLNPLFWKQRQKFSGDKLPS